MEALAHEVTPLNPSRRAIARVRNPIPVPVVCSNCGSAVKLVNNKEIYGKEYGDWPWAYRCVDVECDSHVGLHPYTGIPLGTLANAATRAARSQAKRVFNPLWQEGSMTRTQAYTWLAGKLGFRVEDTHIGFFDEYTCAKVIRICLNKEARK